MNDPKRLDVKFVLACEIITPDNPSFCMLHVVYILIDGPMRPLFPLTLSIHRI